MMTFQLPTDTQHLQVETRQYELFNRPLGQGIVRRRLYVGAAVCAVWFLLLLIIGLSPLSRLGPALYLVPPFATVYIGTRTGDDGRMTALRWYDALLARSPRRRQPVGNPLLASAQQARPEPIRIDGQMTELHPASGNGPVRPLLRRWGRTGLGGEDR